MNALPAWCLIFTTKFPLLIIRFIHSHLVVTLRKVSFLVVSRCLDTYFWAFSFYFVMHLLLWAGHPANSFLTCFTGLIRSSVTTWKRLYLSVVCCCRVLFLSSFMVVVDLSNSMTCLHFNALICSKYDIVKRFPHTYVTLNNSLSNLIISSQRLVTTSASLCTQTGLCHLIL